METIGEYSLEYTSPSLVSFNPQIEQIDFNCVSTGNPDWTIQKETSVTIEFVSFMHFFIRQSLFPILVKQ